MPRAHLKGCLAGLMLSLAPIILADLPARAAAATPSCPHHGKTACRAGARPAHHGGLAKVVHAERGEASWYGPRFAGKRTASGERFDPRRLTAAHPALPLGARATVTNLENGRQVEVRITDRGPYTDGRAIDLSEAAAKRLGMVEDGTAPVRITATKAQIEAAEKDKGERVTVAEGERPKARRRADSCGGCPSRGTRSQAQALRGRRRVPDAQDGLPAGPELARQGGHGRSFLQPLRHAPALIRREARRSAQPLALRLGPAQPRPGALDEEVPLELGDRVDDGHRQLAGRAREVDAAEREAVDPHADLGEPRHRPADVRGVAPQLVELGDHEHVAGLEPVDEAREPRAPGGGEAAGDGLGHATTRWGSMAKPAAAISRSWLSVVWRLAVTERVVESGGKYILVQEAVPDAD